MKLIELVERLDELDDDLTIFAANDPIWSPSSDAVALAEPEDGSLPPEAEGMTYLIEVFLAKDVVNVWQTWRHGHLPSNLEKANAIVYYAENDAYLPL